LEGGELTLKDGQISLIAGAPVKRGTARLRFEKTEVLDGHPCAVFSWSGDYDAEIPILEGEREEWDVSVTKGRLWCSLVYPLVLRQEAEGTVAIVVRDSRGRMKRRIQGAMKSRESLEWKCLAKSGSGA
jgi:hypothetical protein